MRMRLDERGQRLVNRRAHLARAAFVAERRQRNEFQDALRINRIGIAAQRLDARHA